MDGMKKKKLNDLEVRDVFEYKQNVYTVTGVTKDEITVKVIPLPNKNGVFKLGSDGRAITPDIFPKEVNLV